MRFLALVLSGAALFADDRNSPRGKAGEFDYYVLSLSWSPRHCSTPAGERDQLQCNGPRQYNFILHGLWPQYTDGWPQYCSTQEKLSNPVIDKMLDIMPSRGLVRHEWSKHGVCSGLSATEYFAKSRAAFLALRIPNPLQSPKSARTVAPAKIAEEFLGANTGLNRDSLTVSCAGRFFSEVRVCLGKDGRPRSCPALVRRQACRADQVIVQPLR